MAKRIADQGDHLLSPIVTAHCFWAPRCRHTVTDRPQAAHDAMERHYRESATHRLQLAIILGGEY